MRETRNGTLACLCCAIMTALIVFCIGCGGVASIPPLISPTSASLQVNASQQFEYLRASAAREVHWSVNGTPGGNATLGTIDVTGQYTAPSVPPTPNSVTVTVVGTFPYRVDLAASAQVAIVNPEPRLTSISPTLLPAGSAATLSVSGAGFDANSAVLVDGTALVTTFVSPTELTAVLPSTLNGSALHTITVATPAPGGGTTTSQFLTVMAPGAVSPTQNVQVASYSIQSPRDAQVTVGFGRDTSYGLETSTRATPTGGGTVNILVAGMRAFTPYHMRAIVQFTDGTTFYDQDHVFVTSGLTPNRVPPLIATHFGIQNPGVELLDLIAPGTSFVSAVAVDLDGNVIWSYDVGEPQNIVFPVKLLPNGNMLVNIVGTGIPGSIYAVREIDLAGNTVRELTFDDLNQRLAQAGFGLKIGQVHHDVFPLPNGHTILLAARTQDFVNLPGYPGQITVVGDVLIDVDQNFNPVWVWDGFAHMDILRHPWGLPDWTHSNAIVYLPDDGNLLLSMRHQNWILKIDYADGQGTGDVLWRLGPEGDFTLLNGGIADWQYAQHYPTLVSPQSTDPLLAVVDNGDFRPHADGTPCQADCYTRAVLFQVNEIPRTASIVWSDKLPYSFWGGSTQVLDGGNINFDLTNPFAYQASRVLEITQDANPQIVWQLDIQGAFAYRATRIPSLYPGVTW